MQQVHFVFKNKPKFETKIYECEAFTCEAPIHSCFFCEHCSDIFYDFTNGSYALVCDMCSIETYKDCGLHCRDFKEDNHEII